MSNRSGVSVLPNTMATRQGVALAPVPYIMSPYLFGAAAMYPGCTTMVPPVVPPVVTQQPTAMSTPSVMDHNTYAAITRSWQMQQYQQAALHQAYKQHKQEIDIYRKMTVVGQSGGSPEHDPQRESPCVTPVKTPSVDSVKVEVMSPDSSTTRDATVVESNEDGHELIINIKPEVDERTIDNDAKAQTQSGACNSPDVSSTQHISPTNTRKRNASEADTRSPKRYAMNPYTGSVPIPVAATGYPQPSYSYPPYQYPYHSNYGVNPYYSHYQMMYNKQRSPPSDTEPQSEPLDLSPDSSKSPTTETPQKSQTPPCGSSPYTPDSNNRLIGRFTYRYVNKF